MKKIVITLTLIPILLILLLAMLIGVALQQDKMSESDLRFLVDLGQRHGPGAVVEVITRQIYGVDPASDPDPSFGRAHTPGRGHAPWVIRGNLDGRPRMLQFALAPSLWAAYDTQTQSLYQAWEGDVLFEGAAYDYKHGPQPISQGEWYLRDDKGAKWFIEVDGKDIPATVKYLGHEYGTGQKTAAMRFALAADGYRLELTEQPDVTERDGVRYLARHFRRVDSQTSVKAGFRDGNGERYLAQSTLEHPLSATTAIAAQKSPDLSASITTTELARGKMVIDSSDCAGCHALSHKVTGPAWAQIADKFRGKTQSTVKASLTHSVLKGSVGQWGKVPMPPHPQLSQDEAAAAVAYILSVPGERGERNLPINSNGRPYVATQDYDVLPRLASQHPSFRLENLAPKGFEPKVGGLAFRNDGKLVVASWDKDGAVFLVDPKPDRKSQVQRIAEGLHEPLGLTIVDDRLFVLQKQELTELIDNNSDGVIDRYRAVSYDWPSSTNFHSFAFGLLHADDYFYFLLSICVLPGGASCPDQLPTQGKLLRADKAGDVETYASGFRTPNGIAFGPNDDIYVTDNQGDWLPSSKVIQVNEGGFYGSRAVADAGPNRLEETPPTAWLPQDEVGNSPTQPLLLTEGPYAGQMIHGDVYNGGIKRLFLETVDGRQQGAVFHFSGGLQGGVNRMARGPDGAIYLGEVGNPPNWGEHDKLWYGLERMVWVDNVAFEIVTMKAQEDGFLIELTQPLAVNQEISPSDLLVKQWFYHPDEQYGGPKYDETVLAVSALEIATDRRSLRLKIPGLKAGYVIYLRLDDRLRSDTNKPLWTAEAWYTLNVIPEAVPAESVSATSEDGWRNIFDGETLSGWRNYGGATNAVRKWEAQNGTLALVQSGAFPMWDMIKSAAFGGPGGDLVYYRETFQNFELSLQWKISPGGNSGIFYLVKDETENVSWRTGIEMQVLDNEGHRDGQIKTHTAGSLYDMVAADPETVRAPGEWNDVLLRVKDNHIEHWLNGVKVVSIERGSAKWNALAAESKFADMPDYGKFEEGYLVLQDHGDPVWYRNIRVREL
ncbi:MAG: DUF1080 domain-containing protein [Halioglobus sp.]|nr:DUF1080 domain-containing protein [Halioglobus sp.]